MNPSIEETIGHVEQLYVTLTGKQPPHANGGSAPIPPEIDPARHVEEQLGRLMAAIGRLSSTPATPPWIPRLAAWRDDGQLELAIDVPGVPREQLELRLEDRTLVVTGQRPPSWGNAQLETCETPLGPFVRTIALPARVEPDQVSARLEAGVLTIRIVRAPSVRSEPSPIPIKA